MAEAQEKPFSQACENNKQPILEVIKDYFSTGVVLEIGSGTGQHALYFAEHLKPVYWQTSDRVERLTGINLWLNTYRWYNLGRPLAIDVNQKDWPLDEVDGVFSANTAHIMSWSTVENMFDHVGKILRPSHYFCLYGPVNINGEFTADSNREFDRQLKSDNPTMGIRDLEDLQTLGDKTGMSFAQLHPMPANNHLMVWQRNNA